MNITRSNNSDPQRQPFDSTTDLVEASSPRAEQFSDADDFGEPLPEPADFAS